MQSHHDTPPQETILLVDDDPDVLDLVNYHLTATGYRVLACPEFSEALNLLKTTPVSLAVLDIMLPGRSGLELCRQIKADETHHDLPVIFLSARGSEEDRILGFECGAEDYICKPFSPRELVMRIRSVLRRVRDRRAADNLVIGSLVVDFKRRYATNAGKTLTLTDTEFRLLSALASKRGQILNRKDLLAELWAGRVETSSRTLDTHISRMKDKLGPLSERIQTVYGKGYLFS